MDSAPPLPPPPQPSSYPDSVDSSPRSRATTDAWDDQPLPPVPPGTNSGPNTKLRLMCSYEGHIVPRPHDKSLCYVGGDTRIIVIDRHVSLSDLSTRLSKTLLHSNNNFTIKYQLPNEDLDSLISVTTDEDLDNMIDEYDRVSSGPKPARIRLFLFPNKPESASSIGSILDSSTKSEDWFLNALNGTNGGLSRNYSDSTTSSVTNLLGLDGNDVINKMSNDLLGKKNQDVHSVPDSPIMMETTSSFGSTNSTPSLANLPPIRVHVEEQHQQQQQQKGLLGIEEQFGQLTVKQQQQQQQDEGFVVLSSAPQQIPVPLPGSIIATTGLPVHVGGGEDERSDPGGLVGFRKLPTQPFPPPPQQKPPSGGAGAGSGSGVVDLPSPDSVSSDGSLTNRAKAVLYQESAMQIPGGNNRVFGNPNVDPKFNVSDPNTRVQMQQVQEAPGYILQSQLDQHQQQQFFNAGAHYMQHHPSNQMPMSSYYPVYPSQQHPHPQLDHHQYPVYFVPARQAQQAYSLPVQQQQQQQQPNYNDAPPNSIPSSRPQTPPTPSMIPNIAAAYNNPSRNAPPLKTEMPTGMYRTTTTAGGQHQQQYVGYSQVHHPSQSMAPTSVHTANYAYEYPDPAHAQIYYTQPMAPTMPAQYQTMQSSPMVMLSEASSQQSNDNVKQQIRTTQAP